MKKSSVSNKSVSRNARKSKKSSSILEKTELDERCAAIPKHTTDTMLQTSEGQYVQFAEEYNKFGYVPRREKKNLNIIIAVMSGIMIFLN
jgi:hypothetical protein